MSNTADIIIIGAGVHGASLAFHLAAARRKAARAGEEFCRRGRNRPFERTGAHALRRAPGFGTGLGLIRIFQKLG